jgi:4-alpha-glucanotransferase
MIKERSSGVLLHPTSLPGPYGIGDLGPEAYRWIDFLHSTGTRYWQFLPLGPTGYGDSPYQCFSAFAGNPYLISPDGLIEMGLIDKADLSDISVFPKEKVDFGPVIEWKTFLLHKVSQRILEKGFPKNLNEAFESFLFDHKHWIEEYALFMAIKQSVGGVSWADWPKDLKFRVPEALEKAKTQLSEKIFRHKFDQFLFFSQWMKLREYAQSKGVLLIGDMPFVIAFDSADAWSRPDLFLLDENLQPTLVAGVPPDAFGPKGQLWGNPLYNWPAHEAEHYDWWLKRMEATLELVDLVRIDHFRGFAAAWHIPFGNDDAIIGEWVPSPGVALFETFQSRYPKLPIIAEDLGYITPDVVALREDFELPGMRILQFAFDGDPANEFLPHHYTVNSVCYTGTHDNETAKGWYMQADQQNKHFMHKYLDNNDEDVAWVMMRAAFRSVAQLCIVPMQDVLSLDSRARMNNPGIAAGNWGWRMKADAIDEMLVRKFRDLNFTYSRLCETDSAS